MRFSAPDNTIESDIMHVRKEYSRRESKPFPDRIDPDNSAFSRGVNLFRRVSLQYVKKFIFRTHTRYMCPVWFSCAQGQQLGLIFYVELYNEFCSIFSF